MVDFTKLMDPAHQEQMRLEREAEQALAEAHEKTLRGWLNTADQHIEELGEKERSFIRKCRYLLNSCLLLSGPQEKWLKDIAAKFAA